MASAFGHALTAYAVSKLYPKVIVDKKFWILGMVCSIFPDADVVAFKFGIPYEPKFLS